MSDPNAGRPRPGPGRPSPGRRPTPRGTTYTSAAARVDRSGDAVTAPPDPEATAVFSAIPAGASGAAQSPAGPASAEESGSVARNSAVMAAGSLVSRVTGFLRTAAISAAIGALAVGDAYNVANTMPAMVYELLLGGVLTSVVVPLLVRARRNDADHGDAYTHRLLTLSVLILAAATVVAVACAPLIAAVMTSRVADRHLITSLGYLLLPEIFFFGLFAMLAAVLNTRGHFAAPTWTPILNNVVVILTAVTFIALWGVRGQLDASRVTGAQVAVLGIGTTLGILIQGLGLWPALRKVGFRWKWRFDLRELHLRELAHLGGWMLCYVGVSQIGVFVVIRLAKAAGEHAAGGATVYLNAFLIFMMAHGVLVVSVITALMPRMSAAASEKRYADVAGHLSTGTRLSAVLLLPASGAYLLLGTPIAIALFQLGRYSHEAANATGVVIAIAGLGLVPFAISQLQVFAFYALPDTRTPALINIPVVAVRVIVDLLVYWLLPASAVAAGLMVGNAISFVVAAVLGAVLLRRRLGGLGVRRTGRTLGKLTVAAVVAMIPAGLLAYLLTRVIGEGKLASLVTVVLAGGVLAAGYLAGALLLRVAEVNQVWTMVRTRLGR